MLDRNYPHHCNPRHTIPPRAGLYLKRTQATSLNFHCNNYPLEFKTNVWPLLSDRAFKITIRYTGMGQACEIDFFLGFPV